MVDRISAMSVTEQSVSQTHNQAPRVVPLDMEQDSFSDEVRIK